MGKLIAQSSLEIIYPSIPQSNKSFIKGKHKIRAVTMIASNQSY
jgi:hypothetical protein